MGLFAKISGLNRLSEKYPAEETPEGEEIVKQTIQIGAVRYRNCVTVLIHNRGLYLSFNQPLSRSSRLFIPWKDVHSISPTKLYGRKASRLCLGDSGENNLVVYNRLYELMKPYLG